MKKDIFKVWTADENVTLTVCRQEDSADNKPAVIVLPGGGYMACAPREGEPVAERFAEMGYLGCVLRYSTLYTGFEADGPVNVHTVFPEPMRELAAAVKLLRERAEEFGIDRERIAVMGFSAGGHLAANYCNYWDSRRELGEWAERRDEIRPNACVLCYAATYLNAAKSGTMAEAAFGKKQKHTQEELDRYNARLHVSKSTPPTFIWHTADDAMVSVRQSYEMAQALAEHGVPHEVHIFSSGPHAAALSQDLPAQCWPELADGFLKRYM